MEMKRVLVRLQLLKIMLLGAIETRRKLRSLIIVYSQCSSVLCSIKCLGLFSHFYLTFPYLRL